MSKWLDIAQKYEGLTEVQGPQSNPIILGWLQNEGGGKSWVKDDATPWCGAAMAGVFVEAGMADVIPKEPLRARSWATIGEELTEPKVGALAILSRGNNPAEGHVGIIDKFDETRIWLLGGNQGDKFCVAVFQRSRIIPGGIRWPIKTKTPAQMQADGSRIAAAAQRQQLDSAKGTGVSTSPSFPSIPDILSPRESVNGALSDMSWAKSVWGQMCDFASFTGSHWWIIAIVVAGYYFARIAWDGYLIRLWRTEDTNEGWTAP